MTSREKTFGLLLILALAIITGLIISLENAHKHVAQQESVIREKNDSIRYHKRNGKIIAEKAAAEVSPKDFAAAYPDAVKEITRQFDVKVKEMKAYMRAEIAAQGSGQATVVHNHYDSAGRSYPVWTLKASDGYLDFTADVVDSLHAPFRYSYRDTLSTVVYARKKWLLGKESLYSSSMMRNPSAKVSGMTNVLVSNYRDKRWVVSVGVSYDPWHNQFVPAVHAGYSLIKF